MSDWSHPMCDDCWDERNDAHSPFRIIEEHRDDETCCFCGQPTRSGIYVREDPKLLIRHATHAG